MRTNIEIDDKLMANGPLGSPASAPSGRWSMPVAGADREPDEAGRQLLLEARPASIRGRAISTVCADARPGVGVIVVDSSVWIDICAIMRHGRFGCAGF